MQQHGQSEIMPLPADLEEEPGEVNGPDHTPVHGRIAGPACEVSIGCNSSMCSHVDVVLCHTQQTASSDLRMCYFECMSYVEQVNLASACEGYRLPVQRLCFMYLISWS